MPGKCSNIHKHSDHCNSHCGQGSSRRRNTHHQNRDRCNHGYNDHCNWCYNYCYDPCVNPCYNPCCPPCPTGGTATVYTNIAVTGTGPFGVGPQISFTVTNTTGVTAAGVTVYIFASVNPATPVISGVTTGTTIVGTNNISWNIGTLNGGQSATITYVQATPTTWTAVGSTTTPEITVLDNVAQVIVPPPQ